MPCSRYMTVALPHMHNKNVSKHHLLPSVSIQLRKPLLYLLFISDSAFIPVYQNYLNSFLLPVSRNLSCANYKHLLPHLCTYSWFGLILSVVCHIIAFYWTAYTTIISTNKLILKLDFQLGKYDTNPHSHHPILQSKSSCQKILEVQK